MFKNYYCDETDVIRCQRKGFDEQFEIVLNCALFWFMRDVVLRTITYYINSFMSRIFI